MLGALGVTSEEERCYRELLRRPRTTAAELARRLRSDVPATRRSLTALVAKGLANREARGFVPTRPDVAIELLVLERRQALEKVRAASETLLEEFRATGDPDVPVDVVTGRADAILRRWEEVQRSASREVLIVDKPPYVRPPTSANPVELELLAHGISYRILYDETSFAVPGKLEAARECIAAGEQARVLAGLPMKLIVADLDLALTHDVRGPLILDAVIVRRSGLLDGLVALFEELWQRAVPFGRPAESAGPMDATDLEILALLASGSKDETVARQLGLGLRTVRRRAARIMDALGARTRLQAGVQAERLGLV